MTGHTVIGIDADTKRVALCIMQGPTVRQVATIERANTTGRIAPDFDQKLTSLMRWAADHGAVMYLEDIFLKDGSAQNVRGFQSLACVQGELLARARQCGNVPLLLVSASAWRSEVLGFTKDRTKLKLAAGIEAARVLGDAERELTEHESDSVCIALYGSRQAGAVAA